MPQQSNLHSLPLHPIHQINLIAHPSSLSKLSLITPHQLMHHVNHDWNCLRDNGDTTHLNYWAARGACCALTATYPIHCNNASMNDNLHLIAATLLPKILRQTAHYV